MYGYVWINILIRSPPKVYENITYILTHTTGGLAGNSFTQDATNKRTYMVNFKTGETVEKAYLPGEISGLFFPAMCSTSKGALFAGGAAKFENKVLHDPKTQCVIYQKSENTWAILPELPIAVAAAAAICMDVKLYIIGGWGDRRMKMECLDMATMTWSSCPDLLEGLAFPIIACVRDCIYVVLSTWSGNRVTARGLTLQCFDTKTSSWSFKASMPKIVKTSGVAAVTMDDRVFIAGGADQICLSYDTKNDTWTELTLPHERHFLGAAVYVKGKIILSGGYTKDNEPSDTIESYDPATNTWKVLPVKLPKPLTQHYMILA